MSVYASIDKPLILLVLALLMLGAGCGGSSGGEEPCAEGEVRGEEGQCNPYESRFEPAERLDFDNVAGESEFKGGLNPGPPPKSGFRLVLPSQQLQPYEETTFCWVWKMPQNLARQYIYTMRVQTTEGLHHGNMMTLPYDEFEPRAPGLNDDRSCSIFRNLNPAAPPQGLFGNSTQVIGSEAYSFPDGFGMRWLPDRDATISIHLLNPTAEPLWVDVVYDFYTTSHENVGQEVVPVFLDAYEFSIPPQSNHKLVTECAFKNGGNFISILPHMHERGRRYTVELLDEPGGEGEMILEDLDYDTESDIYIYENAPSVDGRWGVRWSCEWENELDETLHYGIGQHEMCTMFGYMYPPYSQTIGQADSETTIGPDGTEFSGDCLTIYMGELATDLGAYDEDTVGAQEDRQ